MLVNKVVIHSPVSVSVSVSVFYLIYEDSILIQYDWCLNSKAVLL